MSVARLCQLSGLSRATLYRTPTPLENASAIEVRVVFKSWRVNVPPMDTAASPLHSDEKGSG